MAIGSGLDGQFGVAAEATVGTPATVTRFFEFNKESIQGVRSGIQGAGIHAGGQYNRLSRYKRTTQTVGGGLDLDVPEKGLGLLLKHMLGSSAAATQIDTTTAYQQVHNPGPLGGLSLTLQKGVPQASDRTVKAYTYRGAKVSEWTLASQTGQNTTLSLTFDAWDEDSATALAAASFPVTGVFDFTQCVIKLGGTASTNTGVTSIAGGVAVDGLTAFELKGTNPLAAERFFLGSAVKAEQLENGYRGVALSLTGEFDKTVLYDLFALDTTTAVQITHTGSLIETGHNFVLDIILPAVRWTVGANVIDGPDIVPTKLDGMALDDQATTPIQITYISTDTTI